MLVTAALVLLLDQVSKTAAARLLAEGRFHAVSGPIGLRLVTSSRSGYIRLTETQSLVVWCAVLFSVALLFATAGPLPVSADIAFGLMLGGATSNLYDRLVRGSVVDFLTIKGWRTFNLADVSMLAGAGLTWSLL